MKISRRKILQVTGGATVGVALGGAAVGLSKLFGSSKMAPAEIFEWHGKNFSDVHQSLSEAELNYIHQAFAVTESNGYNVTDDFFYSGFTFSHRLTRSGINSTRFAVGSYSKPGALISLAKTAIERRGIDYGQIPFIENFGGLGWDLEADLFKVYCKVSAIPETLPPALLNLLKQVQPGSFAQFGLFSQTFEKGQVVENKVYLPLLDSGLENYKKAFPFADNIIHINLMLSDTRGIIPQADLDLRSSIAPYLGAKAKELVDKFSRVQLPIDTLTYSDSERMTLYFG